LKIGLIISLITLDVTLIVPDLQDMHVTTIFPALVDTAETILLIQMKNNCSAMIGIYKTGMDAVTNVLLKQDGLVLYLTRPLLLQEMTFSHLVQRPISVTSELILFIMSNVMKDLIRKSMILMKMFTFQEDVSMDGFKKITFVILTMVNVKNRFGSQ